MMRRVATIAVRSATGIVAQNETIVNEMKRPILVVLQLCPISSRQQLVGEIFHTILEDVSDTAIHQRFELEHSFSPLVIRSSLPTTIVHTRPRTVGGMPCQNSFCTFSVFPLIATKQQAQSKAFAFQPARLTISANLPVRFPIAFCF